MLHPETSHGSALSDTSVLGSPLTSLTITTDAITSSATSKHGHTAAAGNDEQVLASVTALTIRVEILLKEDADGYVPAMPGFLTVYEDEQAMLSTIEPMFTVLSGSMDSPQSVPPSSICAVLFLDQRALDRHRDSLPSGVRGELLQRLATDPEELLIGCGPPWVQILDQVQKFAYARLMDGLNLLARQIFVDAAEVTWRLIREEGRVLLMRWRAQRQDA